MRNSKAKRLRKMAKSIVGVTDTQKDFKWCQYEQNRKTRVINLVKTCGRALYQKAKVEL